MLAKDILAYCKKELIHPEDENERGAICKILLEDKYEIGVIKLLQNMAISINMEQLAEDLYLLNQQFPVQQVVGFTYFLDHKFKISKETLIPRPETEELVNTLITEYLRPNQRYNILDIGTGSGCIPICLKLALPHSNVESWDVSPEALAIANENAKNLGATIEFRLQDALQKDLPKKSLDLIVSNPPYVRNSEKAEIAANVLNHEPHLALFVSDDNPLVFYKAIGEYAIENLTKEGLLAFEINSYLGKDTMDLVRGLGFGNVLLRKDLFGKDRFIFAKK